MWFPACVLLQWRLVFLDVPAIQPPPYVPELSFRRHPSCHQIALISAGLTPHLPHRNMPDS